MAKADKDPGKTSIQIIEHMMMLLDVPADYADPVSLKALSASAGLHPSTAHRILSDMVACHSADRSDSGSYRLDICLLELDNLVKVRLPIREATLAPMHVLYRLAGQAVNLSMYQGDEIVYVEHAYSRRSGVQAVCATGGRAPLYLISVGKLFLVADELGRVHACTTRMGLPGRIRTSTTDLPKLERELNWVYINGCVCDSEELESGVCCIAAGIYDDSRRLVVGLSLSAPVDWLQDS